MKRLVLSLCLSACMLLPGVTLAQAQTASPCQYILGFKTLHDLDPADIGECLDNQTFAGNGDAQQHTSKGLMAWRKADNWTAFTNGYMTWINGPDGLVHRLNTDRFPWEHDTQAAAAASPAAQSTTQVVTNSGNQSVSVTLPAGLLETQASCGPCSDNFIAELDDPQGLQVALLANTIGTSASLRATRISAGTYTLSVEANGSWRIQLTSMAAVTSAPAPSGPIKGHGDSVVSLALKAGLLTLASNYNDTGSFDTYLGPDNFTVEALAADGSRVGLLANRIGTGNDQKTVVLPSDGVYLLQVESQGDWTLTASQ